MSLERTDRNCFRNCTGYDPCSDECDVCLADEEDRYDRPMQIGRSNMRRAEVEARVKGEEQKP